MSQKVLILSSSPRKGGNSDRLCQEFARGASEAGNQVEMIRLAEKSIHFCQGCYVCKKGNGCFQKDDVAEILQKMLEADRIVLATPVYFYSMAAQLKALIDRSVSIYPISGKKFYYLATMADTDEKLGLRAIDSLRGFFDCCENSTEEGVLLVTGVYEKGEIENRPELQQAYEMGKGIA